MNSLITDQIIVNGHRIACGTQGDGEPVVFLHGTPSSSLIWRNIAPRVAQQGYRAHVFDLLGFGLSERPQDPQVDTSMSAQVEILKAMLNHWGLTRFHLVAHDIGGGIAQRFGVFHPERLISLTMIDVVSYDSYPSLRTRKQMAQGLDALAKTPDDAHRRHFRDWLLSAVYHKQSFADGPLETYLDYISGWIGQPSLFQHQVRHYDPRHTMEVADRLSELGQMPVQLIWGADDDWQVLDWAYKLQTAIPGSGLTVLEKCGHFSPEDQPERIAALVLDHIEIARQSAA